MLCAAVSTGLMAATSFTFDDTSSISQNADGFSVTIAQAAGSTAPTYNNGLRLYAKNTITVTGTGITSIQIAFTKQGSKAYATLSATPGSLVDGGTSTSNDDVKIDVWTGSASSVTFTLGDSGQRLIKQLVINGEITVDPVDPQPEDEEQLDPNYDYDEPTTVMNPDKFVQGAAYRFIDNNIEVKASKGRIDTIEGYFSAHAAETITFTATKPMKGLVIDGFVKKDFEATVDHGTIDFLSSSDEDTEADPVIVIKDINSTSVTISCVKQLRCYSVDIYFEENPDEEIDHSSTTTGETYFVTYDAADFVYESEYSTEGDYNYTVYLYNEAEEYPYIGLDLYTTVKDAFAGTYSFDDGNLSDYSFYQYTESEDDYEWASDGALAITVNGTQCTISGYITLENGDTYNFTYEGTLNIYTDEDYYEAIETAYPPLDSNAPMYDILGRRVGKNYHGVVLQEGNKYLLR